MRTKVKISLEKEKIKKEIGKHKATLYALENCSCVIIDIIDHSAEEGSYYNGIDDLSFDKIKEIGNEIETDYSNKYGKGYLSLAVNYKNFFEWYWYFEDKEKLTEEINRLKKLIANLEEEL